MRQTKEQQKPLADSEEEAGKEVNFRTRNALVKREKMLARLLAATMQVCADSNRRGPAMIDDVVKAAGVSRGAFYWYFDSLDDAIEMLGRQMADEIRADAYALFHEEPSSVLRAALGGQVMMFRAVMDPVWARYLSNVHVLMDDSKFVTAVRRNLDLGREIGKFKFESTMVASDFHIGALISAVRRCTVGPPPSIETLVEMNVLILRGLGVTTASANQIANRARQIVSELGPEKLAWWKPIF